MAKSSNTTKELKVRQREAHQRLDQYLRASIPGLSRGAALRLLRQGKVRVDGRAAKKGTLLRPGQRVTVDAGAWQASPAPQPEAPLAVLAEDERLVAINKLPGVACHPLTPGETGTVVNALVARYPECAGVSPDPREGGLVHRLDTSTSGVLLAARTREAHQELREYFGEGRVHKEYLALVQGAVDQPGEVVSAFRAFPGDRRRVEVVSQYSAAGGKLAETRFSPEERLDAGHTLVRVECSTGQRHQVRAHLAHAGLPVADDTLYGAAAVDGCLGAFLHASRVELPGGAVFEAELPAGRAAVLERLRIG